MIFEFLLLFLSVFYPWQGDESYYLFSIPPCPLFSLFTQGGIRIYLSLLIVLPWFTRHTCHSIIYSNIGQIINYNNCNTIKLYLSTYKNMLSTLFEHWLWIDLVDTEIVRKPSKSLSK